MGHQNFVEIHPETRQINLHQEKLKTNSSVFIGTRTLDRNSLKFLSTNSPFQQLKKPDISNLNAFKL